jgi:hypothetical protein
MSDTPAYLLPVAPPATGYPTVEDLLGGAGGVVECNVTVPFWVRADGSAATVRVRGLDLEAQERIRLKAARAVAPEDRALGSTQHGPTFAAATIAEAFTAPVLTFEQAYKLLKGRHAKSIELLVNYIWAISAVSQESLDAIVANEAAADMAAAQQLAAAGVDASGQPPAE